jgi:hypothetical protein
MIANIEETDLTTIDSKINEMRNILNATHQLKIYEESRRNNKLLHKESVHKDEVKLNAKKRKLSLNYTPVKNPFKKSPPQQSTSQQLLTTSQQSVSPNQISTSQGSVPPQQLSTSQQSVIPPKSPQRPVTRGGLQKSLSLATLNISVPESMQH